MRHVLHTNRICTPISLSNVSYLNFFGLNGMLYSNGKQTSIRQLTPPDSSYSLQTSRFLLKSTYIYFPFRLPTLEEKARDSELTDLIETTKQEANPPLRTLHHIIGNFFKPSAVLAALGGTNSIQNFVNGLRMVHLSRRLRLRGLWVESCVMGLGKPKVFSARWFLTS